MTHKNQPVKTLTMQAAKLHVELQAPVATPVTLYPESAPISYYAPLEIALKPSLMTQLKRRFKGLLSTNNKDVILTPEFSGE